VKVRIEIPNFRLVGKERPRVVRANIGVGAARALASQGFAGPKTVTFTPARTVACEEAIKIEYIAQTGRRLFSGRVAVSIGFTGGRIDIDNGIKTVLDALNGVAYADDRQVDVVSARRLTKGRGEPDRLVIEVADATA
jgi:Holliday junction resolvase RusA-like endonuclease